MADGRKRRSGDFQERSACMNLPGLMRRGLAVRTILFFLDIMFAMNIIEHYVKVIHEHRAAAQEADGDAVAA